MTRADSALADADNDTARKLLDAVTRVAPDYAEGWHARAQLQAAANDDTGAMISLQKAVTLNPRQFTAMTELAGMLEDYGDKAGALKLFRRALALDPQNGLARRGRKRLWKGKSKARDLIEAGLCHLALVVRHLITSCFARRRVCRRLSDWRLVRPGPAL